jgi:hypothetical protein
MKKTTGFFHNAAETLRRKAEHLVEQVRDDGGYPDAAEDSRGLEAAKEASRISQIVRAALSEPPSERRRDTSKGSRAPGVTADGLHGVIERRSDR